MAAEVLVRNICAWFNFVIYTNRFPVKDFKSGKLLSLDLLSRYEVRHVNMK
jgi:hypothetical protein